MGPRGPATLPMDLMLDIILRNDDVASLVRCAMSSKTLLRGLLGFLGDRAKAHGGFDPSLLMAVSYTGIGRTDSAVIQQPGGLRCFGADLLAGSPTSRDGLVVFFTNRILVRNTITGRVTTLPSMDLPDSTTRSFGEMYQPALLSVEGAGRSFELLVVYQEFHPGWSLGTQIFSSREQEWGAARRIHIHNMPPLITRLKEGASTAPAVVGRTVHWLCYTQQPNSNGTRWIDRDLAILALHAESAQATVIKLPQELLTRMGSPGTGNNGPKLSEMLILATTATKAGGKQLSLVVAEALVISTWTLVANEGPSIRWSRQVVIRRLKIDRPLAYALDAYQPIWFRTFGERSGTVLLDAEDWARPAQPWD